jgi:hypothetical protein
MPALRWDRAAVNTLCCSLYAAKRNAGKAYMKTGIFPDFATLHPGYGC